MVIIRHSPRRALQSIYTSKHIITNYGNYIKLRIFNTDLCLSQTSEAKAKKGMIVKMKTKPYKSQKTWCCKHTGGLEAYLVYNKIKIKNIKPRVLYINFCVFRINIKNAWFYVIYFKCRYKFKNI